MKFASYYFILDLVVVANELGNYIRGFDSFVQSKKYETKVKIVQRYPEMHYFRKRKTIEIIGCEVEFLKCKIFFVELL